MSAPASSSSSSALPGGRTGKRRRPDGSSVSFTTSANGERHGRATEIFESGSVKIDFAYVNGVRQGPAKLTSHSEKRSRSIEFTIEYYYVDGVSQGKATETIFVGADAPRSIEFSYVDSRLQGKATESFSDGRVIEFSYADGVRQGAATARFPDGRAVSLRYENGDLKREDALLPAMDGVSSRPRQVYPPIYTRCLYPSIYVILPKQSLLTTSPPPLARDLERPVEV